MKGLMTLILASLSIGQIFASPEDNVVKDVLYNEYRQEIESGDKSQQGKNKTSLTANSGISAFDQNLYVDALWDLVEEESPKALDALDDLDPFYYDIVQRLRIHILRIKYKHEIEVSELFAQELENELKKPKVNLQLIYLMAAYENEISNSTLGTLLPLAKLSKSYKNVAKYSGIKNSVSNDVISDIFYRSPDNADFGEGEYSGSLKLFLFCRQNRQYPCLMVMRDHEGEVFRKEDGSIWTHKALALSASEQPSYKRNGNTPTGVMTIDSVMPEADMPINFGVNRRIILNFIPKTKKEELIKSALPVTSHTESWWKAANTARDIGRNFLRIHGTGKINTTPQVPYYPFRKTNGCISQRENTYDGITFNDQRILLDSMMKALNLEPIFENETEIKGLLYIVEVDNKKKEMTIEDLKLRGIE